MPKVPMFTLAWSPARAAYELYQTRSRETLGIVPDSLAWFAWLEQVSSFAFSGKSADLTLARLEHIAGRLRAQSEDQVLLPISPRAGTDGEVETAQPPLLAQQHHPLHPLLATKLHVPRPRAQLVPRAHLTEQLQQGVERALILVSAPAGFGKTTLLAQWFAESGTPVAWLSLEAEDNDPTRFLSYLIAALQRLVAQVGTTALEMLRTPQPPSTEAVLAVLTNDLVERGGVDFALVLDDYHVITADPIHRGMTFLLEHMPPQLHLVLVTRADPPLPLARLRARGQLCEVRAADLRFGTAEASTFLQTVMGLDLAPEAIAILESHTEGWIAGLQLAALSLQGRADVSGFLTTFTGSHRYVLDYLSEEVLVRQPELVQAFLLRTSILERLSGSLCDAVMDQEGSQAMLEALERANLFVVALDDERRWYRYHHLFVQALRSHLQQRDPISPPVLHRRASAWYEQHELPAEAVQHALDVPDVGRAARLIEPIALPLTLHGQIYTVLGWLNALPKALVRTRPFLCVYHASLLTFTNQLEPAEARLQEAEQGVQKEVSASQAQIIMGYVFTIRGDIALFSGDIPQAVSLARQALELLSEAEIIPRAGALVTTVRAYLVSGDVTSETEHAVAAAAAFIRTSGNLFATVSSMTLLARLHILQGRLRQAAATYAQLAQGMALVKETLTMEPFVAVLGYSALARLQQARGNSRAALSTLERALVLAASEGYIRLFVDEGPSMLALLRLANARGILPGYVATLLSAFGEQHALDLPLPAARPVSLVEPLTERERDVLRLLLDGISNREIAHRLVVSVNTVKRHVYNICGKLGVQSRAQAIIRARTLNLQ